MSKWIDYDQYLKSDEWRAQRAMALERAGYKCSICGETDCLNVHHKTYAHLGNERPEELQVLCKTHHWIEHNPGKPIPDKIDEIEIDAQRKISEERGCKHLAFTIGKIDRILDSRDRDSLLPAQLRRVLELEERAKSHVIRCEVCNPDVSKLYTWEERQEMKIASDKEREYRRKLRKQERGKEKRSRKVKGKLRQQ
jgi:hypothetical protein